MQQGSRIGGVILLPDGEVNGGDILRRWTNDRFLSTPHRVINAAGQTRYAIPFFLDPHPDTVIPCLPNCQDARTPPRHEDITCHDYALRYASRNYRHLKAAAETAEAG